MWYYKELVKISTDLSTSSSLSDGNRGLHTNWPVSLFPTGALNTSGPVQNGNYYSLCCLLSLFQVLSILSFHFYIPLLPLPLSLSLSLVPLLSQADSDELPVGLGDPSCRIPHLNTHCRVFPLLSSLSSLEYPPIPRLVRFSGGNWR